MGSAVASAEEYSQAACGRRPGAQRRLRAWVHQVGPCLKLAERQQQQRAPPGFVETLPPRPGALQPLLAVLLIGLRLLLASLLPRLGSRRRQRCQAGNRRR